MTLRPRSICLISGGIQPNRLHLQPWRYLSEVALQLAGRGHQVTMITGGAGDSAALKSPRLTLKRIPSVLNYFWACNHPLRAAIASARPDLILWHLGLTSLVHQRFAGPPGIPVIGIFTSPLYRWSDLATIGWSRLLCSPHLSAIHIIGALLPRTLLGHRISCSPALQRLVFQTESTLCHLRSSGIWSGPVRVIPPGVDPIWTNGRVQHSVSTMRASLGYRQDHKVVVYFGSPESLRGLPRLLEAFPILHRNHPEVRLLILSRPPGQLRYARRRLRSLQGPACLHPYVQVVSGFLEPQDLVTHVAAADVVALPLELVPSDAPLSLLEARALGKPVVTTNQACLPELTGPDCYGIADTGSTASLVAALEAALFHTSFSTVECTSPNATAHSRLWSQVGADWEALIDSL